MHENTFYSGLNSNKRRLSKFENGQDTLREDTVLKGSSTNTVTEAVEPPAQTIETQVEYFDDEKE